MSEYAVQNQINAVCKDEEIARFKAEVESLRQENLSGLELAKIAITIDALKQENK